MERLLTPDDVSGITGISTGALANMRYMGTGPAYRRLSAKAIRYTPADVQDFIDQARRTQTGESVAV